MRLWGVGRALVCATVGNAFWGYCGGLRVCWGECGDPGIVAFVGCEHGQGVLGGSVSMG